MVEHLTFNQRASSSSLDRVTFFNFYMAWFKTKVTESENISDKYNTLVCSYNELQDYVKKVLEEKNKEISTLSENITKKDKELNT